MAPRGDCGWQYNKTLMECNRYMLDNEIATDVSFELRAPDGATVIIRAHKYMLTSRSAVFEAMFSSGMLETQYGSEARVKINDIELEVFKDVLNFVYCEEANVTPASALPLMYAAEKYMLPKLVGQCGKCLKDSLTIDNVGDILNLSLLFDEEELKTTCLDFISKNPSDVLSVENLQKIPRQAMEAILRMDTMAQDETFVYNACVNWAKVQLKNCQSVDHPNDEQIRETLGDLIFEIRFPAMSAKQFVDIIEDCNVLSFEEQSSLFCYIISGRKKECMRFNCKARQGKEYGEEVFIDRSGRHSLAWVSGPDAIDFQTNRQILLSGLGLYTESKANGCGYIVDIEVRKSMEVLSRKSTSVPFTGSPTPYKVTFETPITIEPQTTYTLVACSPAGKNLYFGSSCQIMCTKDNVTITFSSSGRTNNGTDATQGQIPRLYYRPAT